MVSVCVSILIVVVVDFGMVSVIDMGGFGVVFSVILVKILSCLCDLVISLIRL